MCRILARARTGLLSAAALGAFIAALVGVAPVAGPDGIGLSGTAALADDDD